MNLIVKCYQHQFNIMAGLRNIQSLHLTVFIHFDEYWNCFCARDE